MSDKADGIHAFVTVHDQKCRIIADKYYEFSLSAKNNSDKGATSVTILDCELIQPKSDEKNAQDDKKSELDQPKATEEKKQEKKKKKKDKKEESDDDQKPAELPARI